MAAVLVAQVLEQRPEDALARAVKIELLMRLGEIEQATQLTADTLRQPELAVWLREHLRNVTEG